MRELLWEVQVLSPPPVRRHCSKCGEKTEFQSSGLFRINAQRKSLDIWLVYRCIACKTTWNLPVFSRISPGRLPRELLERFHKNDPELARRVAADSAHLNRSGAEVLPPVCRILGEDLDLTVPARLLIRSPYPLPLKVASLLREKLALSQRELERLFETGAISLPQGQDYRKCRLGREIEVTVRGGPQ